MPDLPPVPPSISRIAAPLLIAGLANWCLYGVLVVQCYVYSYNFPEDKRSLKLFVYGILLIETIQTALNGADLYYWFVSGFGNVDHLASFVAASFDVPLMESIVAFSVQLFYVYRIWVLSAKRAWLFCVGICLFATVGAAGAFGGGVYTELHRRFARGRTLKSLAFTWLIGNACADILIASAMIYYLMKRRRGAGSAFTDNSLVKIVRLTIETNVLTTSVGIAALLMVVVYPDENWYTGPTGVLGKLYSNTLLVWLNNRISIRDAATTPRGVASRPGALAFAINPRSESGTHIAFTDIERPSPTYKTSIGSTGEAK